MNVIKVGTEYKIYNDATETFEFLPARTYIVRFSKMTGFYLEEYHELEIKEKKIYGVHENKVNKVLRRFNDAEKNFGVILSGEKGIGKSLCARMIANQAVREGYPVIVVDAFYPGISSFIEEIEQNVVLLFDEFDKTFHLNDSNGDMNDPQTSLLSVFDGMSCGKKLFVITCNNIHKLNEFFVNRPGRFYYHFRFDYPNFDEISEYLFDKVKPEYHSEIPQVVAFAQKINLNYDCLGAIASELNYGESFSDAIQDLNIMNMGKDSYNASVILEDGRTVYTRYAQNINLFNSSSITVTTVNEQQRYEYEFSFNSKDIQADSELKCVRVDGNKITVDFYYPEDAEDGKELPKVKYLILQKSVEDKYKYLV